MLTSILSAPNAQAPQAPELIQILPEPVDGIIRGRDGRSFEFVGWDIVIDWVSAMPGAAIPVDINHALAKGGDGEAQAWISANSLTVIPGQGLWGRPEWTAAGRETMARGGYRFTSPVVMHDHVSEADGALGRMVGLAAVALTNDPNLAIMALNSADFRRTEEKPKMLEELKKLFGGDKSKLKAALAELEAAEAAPPEAPVEEPAKEPTAPALTAEGIAAAVIAGLRGLEAPAPAAPEPPPVAPEAAPNAFEAASEALIQAAVADGRLTPGHAAQYSRACNAAKFEGLKTALAGLTPALPERQSPKGAPRQQASTHAAQEVKGLARAMGVTVETLTDVENDRGVSRFEYESAWSGKKKEG